MGVRALITGISGFAGKVLAEHLLALGDEVHGLVREREKDAPILERAGLLARLGGVHEGDLADAGAAEGLRRALEAARPERVYHLAGFSSPRLSLEDPLGALRLNALGTAALLEAIRRSGARPRTLVIGSGESYGRTAATAPPGALLGEDLPLRPMTPYGASKAAVEALALAAFHSYGVPAIVARAFNHLGAGQEAAFAAPAFARQVARAEAGLQPPEVRVGNLAPTRDLSDVRDVARAYRLLTEKGRPGEVYNVCSGRSVTMREVVDRLVAGARRPLAIVEDPALFRAADIDRLVGDPAKLSRETGYEARHSIEETIDWVREDWRARVAPAGS